MHCIHSRIWYTLVGYLNWCQPFSFCAQGVWGIFWLFTLDVCSHFWFGNRQKFCPGHTTVTIAIQSFFSWSLCFDVYCIICSASAGSNLSSQCLFYCLLNESSSICDGCEMVDTSDGRWQKKSLRCLSDRSEGNCSSVGHYRFYCWRSRCPIATCRVLSKTCRIKFGFICSYYIWVK